jgi:hypothetical protein
MPGLSRRTVYVIWAAGALALSAVTVWAVLAMRPGGAPELAPEPLQVGLEAPGLISIGNTVPMAVSAVGPDPLTRLEVWVGDDLVDSSELEGEDTWVSATLEWRPATPGPASAVARVLDSAGRVATSPSVLLDVAAPDPTLVTISDPDGMTLTALAETSGVPVEALLDINPGATPNALMAQGTQVLVPSPSGAPSSEPGPPGDGSASLEGDVIHFDGDILGLFAYIEVDGEVWRAPADPSELLEGDGSYDLGPHLAKLPPGDKDIEVWARIGDSVKNVGEFSESGARSLLPTTELSALLDLSFLSTPVPMKSLAVTDEDVVDFEWSSTISHAGVRWFVATEKPGPASSLTPKGLRQTGTASVETADSTFSIDMAMNTVPTVVKQPIQSTTLIDSGSVVLPGAGDPVRQLSVLDPPGTHWAWAVPIDAEGDIVGPPSNPVRLIITKAPYDPSDDPPYDVLGVDVEVPPAPNPTLEHCVRIVSESPRFPKNLGYVYQNGTPVGHGGMKVTGTLPYTLDGNGLALYPFTACPGEKGSFQWGSVGCGLDPFCHVSKGLGALGQAALDAGEFIVGLANRAKEAYDQLKAWVIAQVATTLCPDEIAGACDTLITVAVDALLASVGVPPTMPDFDDVADLAKGQAIDLALDQLGVGTACDAIAGGATGKTCGELAVAMGEKDVCAMAPEGQEQTCEQIVGQAQQACQVAAQASKCEQLTMTARDLVETGMNHAYDLAVEATEDQVTQAMGTALGFNLVTDSNHGCVWGGPQGDKVICPDTGLFQDPPVGCWREAYGADKGKVKCSKPPTEIEAIPEPRGQQQPIRVDVVLKRNENLMPEGFVCPPIYALATTITPRGAVGEPYLAAFAPIGPPILPGIDTYHVTLWLSEPNPAAVIPADKRPPPPPSETTNSGGVGTTQHVLSAVGPGYDWMFLLEEGSLLGVQVFGDCIPKTTADGPFGVAGKVPAPLPRLIPGEQD